MSSPAVHLLSVSTLYSIVDTLKSGQPQFGKIKYRDGENMELFGDISKIKTLLNWKPKVDLETGIRKTIESIKSKQL